MEHVSIEMTTDMDRSGDQDEGPSPRAGGDEGISNAHEVQINEDQDAGGESDSGNEINFPKSLLKRIVKEQLINSREAAIRDNDSIDCSRVQVRGILLLSGSLVWLHVA